MSHFIQGFSVVIGVALILFGAIGIGWHVRNVYVRSRRTAEQIVARIKSDERPCPLHPPHAELSDLFCSQCGVFKLAGVYEDQDPEAIRKKRVEWAQAGWEPRRKGRSRD